MRIDVALVNAGFFESRNRAADAIKNGAVFVKKEFKDVNLDEEMFISFGLFSLDFEKCEYDSATKTYTSESFRFLSSINLNNLV